MLFNPLQGPFLKLPAFEISPVPLYNSAGRKTPMRMESLNWFDVQNYLEQDDRLIVILGSCEQHGYLSLLTDAKIPAALADAASQQSGVLVAPPLNFGASPYFLAYPGTISLRLTTLLDVAEDLVRSVYRHGFRRLLFLNGHGGNDAVRARLYELANLLPGLQIRWYAWWQSHSVEAVAVKHGLKVYHAGWAEAFPFTRVGELPEGSKVPPSIPGLLSSKQSRQVYGDGVFGGPYAVDENITNEVFNAALQDILYLLGFE
jgi:creatinine amidohydrolase